MKTMKARRIWIDNFNSKRHRKQDRLQYAEQTSLTIDRESKIFHVKIRYKQYISTHSAMQNILEEKFQF